MEFKKLAEYLDRLERTSSRIEITKILAELFRKSDKGEIDKVVYLSLGELAPQYKGIVFNIAERMMAQAIAKAYGQKVEKVRDIYKKKGDLGDVVAALAAKSKIPASPAGRQNPKSKYLLVTDVYIKLLKIAQDEGEGSQDRKIIKTANLLSNLDLLSAKFVARIPIGNLRLGFSDKTVIDALSWMEKGDKSVKNELEKAYYVLPDVGLLAKNVKSYGVKKAVKKIKPVIGVPVLPMLAQRLKSPVEMIEKMGEVAIEPKFDGLRISLHYKSGKNGFVKAFTRNMNETSWMFPELKDIAKYLSAHEVILDSEAVGVDEVRQGLANFQKTMTRRRKHEIQDKALKIPIKFHVFDILIKDGKSLLSMPYIKRRKILAKTVKSGKILEVVDYLITSDPKTIVKEMAREVKGGMEGIIVKRADSEYVAGRTGWRWVKMKEAESKVSKLSDTLDCVVMGYTTGRGKRVSFGIGQFLVGIKDNDKFKTVTKVGTGLTDELFREMKKRLKMLEVNYQPKEFEVDKNLKPDFWVAPSLVVEIAADEITKSPKHTAGYALRFPRLVRFRDDKNPDQATSLSEFKKLFEIQKI